MPPKVKFKKDEIIKGALDVVRAKGFSCLSAREIAAVLNASTRPIFTYYSSMDELKRDVYEAAKNIHREYIMRGLKEKIPFLDVGMNYIKFAREEPELYKLLYLTKPDGVSGGAMESLKMSQDMIRDSLMRIYNIDEFTADCYYRDLWLVVFAFAALIVTNDCPYTDEQMGAILSEVSLSICRTYKEIPGFFEGKFDKNAVFTELVKIK